MFKINNNYDISLTQGDNASISLNIRGYKLLTNDKICLIIYNSEKIAEMDTTDFIDGTAYFTLTEDFTLSIPIGDHKYQIKAILPSMNYTATLIEGRDFKVKRGFNCGK